MSKAHSLATVLFFVASSCYAAQECANFAIGVGAMVDAKNTGVTYAAAKQKIAENKKNNSASNYEGMVAILKVAYENIPATMTAVNASEIAFFSCKKENKIESPSDICFKISYMAGLAAIERDKGKNMDSLLLETKNTVWVEPVIRLAYKERNKVPWDLQQEQYVKCKNVLPKNK